MRQQKNTVLLQNELSLQFPSISVNEGCARSLVSAFVAQLNPTIEELADIKCAISEAVTNCIVHGYRDTYGMIFIRIKIWENRFIKIEIKDKGCGIADIPQAMTPLFTTDTTGERSGMGFSVMQSFSDHLQVRSKPGKGTCVILSKQLSPLARNLRG